MARPAKQESDAALRDYLLQERREFRTRMCSILLNDSPKSAK